MEQRLNDHSQEQEFSMKSILLPLVAIILGCFMVILDTTAMNVALSKLVEDFHTQLPTLQWTVTGYMLAQAAVIPLAGWLSDRFGAKTVFLTSVILFTLGSLLCALPNDPQTLIAFRVIQGLGGGFVLPVAMAYVYRLSPPSKVGQVMGMLGVPILLAPAIGPILSGWLVEYHSWRWIFLINLPVGIISVLFGLWKLPKLATKKLAGLDIPGMILGPLAFAALSYGVNQGAESWTSDKTLSGLIVGGIALIVFIIVELRAKHPLLDLRVFRSVDFSFGIVVQWIVQFSLFGAIFLLPQFLQQGRGYGAFDTGLTLFPQALASACMMPIGGYLFDRIGVRWLVVIGLSLVSGAIFQYSNLDIHTGREDLLLPLIMAGSGMGLMMMPLNSHLINKTPRELVSRVTSLTSAMQQVISSLAVALLVTILTKRIAKLMVEANVPPEALANQTAGSGAAQASPEQLQQLLALAVDAFDYTFGIMVFVAIAGALLGLLLRRGKKSSGENTQAEKPEAALEGLHMG
ncbi:MULTISPECIES: DHA2 family efflux MFS transporter permease subunit [unclassified Paenibacillus]|uniref:DHA2 family efflux MFS transporter permease subunit n=1 Tax=unclassified Paenibacillus TaxID=185978 RepID=UPI00104CE673|nr:MULTISPECIES: DHA2 family efflux MFS transporter permease subunit [unclassified Paenibacillus]NIK71228.1 EmrB/QacA subfamily drug resistance transporter [Paenibacillus sp. BK720]TCM97052.1 EmrB/QacA subfamily drug resistance transporter [Paenibacillus sp. BK033]